MAIKINFDNSFSNLPNKFYSKIFPEKTKKPNLIILNKNLCDELNLNYKDLSSTEGKRFNHWRSEKTTQTEKSQWG